MAEKKKTAPEQKTFYRTDPLTGEKTERIVVTPADEVRAKFDGYCPKESSRKSSSSSQDAAAEQTAEDASSQ